MFHWIAGDGMLFITESRLLLRYVLGGSQLTVTSAAGSMTFERAPGDAQVSVAENAGTRRRT